MMFICDECLHVVFITGDSMNDAYTKRKAHLCMSCVYGLSIDRFRYWMELIDRLGYE